MRMKEKCYLKLSVSENEWNEMRAGVDYGMCCLFGLGKVRKMCVTEAVKVFLEDGWRKRGINGDRTPSQWRS